ncbi:MAG: (d)CMP kinase [Anaerolineales bacterium]|nr:(d)CMP kinase [Anaerolineales bacterium]
MSKPSTIAIDGSAASGKSTVGARLAQRLGYLYFDTGVMYRAVTWAVLSRKINPENVEVVSELAEKLLIEVKPNGPQDGRLYTVLTDGQDITWQIRSPEVEAYVSLVSSYPRVRAALIAQQRRIAASGSIVMVGRDIGTVVLPEADLKVFMHASAEERARRRYHEILTQGKQADFEEILKAMRERDKQDREKPISPMVPASDAVIIETDNLSLESVLTRLEQLIVAEQTMGQVENKR